MKKQILFISIRIVLTAALIAALGVSYSKIDALLSPMERKVLEAYLAGYDYLQIAEAMGKPAKSIDNALQRIRRKVASLLFA